MSFFSIRKATFLFTIYLCVSNAFGQEPPKDVDFFFESDTIKVTQGQTFNNYVMVKNLTDAPLHITNIEAEQAYPGLLLSPKKGMTIAAHDEERLFVKFIATTDFMMLESNEINFILSYKTSENVEKTVTATFYKKQNHAEEIYIYPFASENYIDPSVPESTVSIFVENSGYSRRSIQLGFESNYGGMTIRPRQTTVNLEGKEKQLIELAISIREQKSYFPDYNVQIRATDLITNKEIQTSKVKIIVLSNHTQVMHNQNFSTDKNYIETAYNQMGNGFDYMQIKGNTEMNLGNEMYGRFNTAIDYYLNQDAYSLYNTYLELEKKGNSLSLGNIYGYDYDYSISGRGGKVAVNLGSHKEIEVLGVDNNYNIYSNYISDIEDAKTIGAKYSFGHHHSFNGKISYLFDHDPLSSVDAHLAHYSSAFKLKEKHNFQLEAGLSHEKGLSNHKERAGISTSVNYDYRHENWEFSSLNSWATQNYAGMNRGAFNLYQNIGYRLYEHTRLFLHYQNTQSAPEYTTHHTSGSALYPNISNNYYSTHSIKTGIQVAKNKWNYLLSPQIEKQKNINNFINQGMTSYRFRATAGTSLKAHNFNVSAEYSFSETSNSDDSFSSLKTMLTYRFKGFSLNGTAQYNPYNVHDLNYFSDSTKDFLNYSIYSSYNFRLLKNTLNGNISASLNYSELYHNLNHNINSSVEFKLTPSWAGTAYVNYSNYESLLANSYKGDNYQFKIGIKKYFINTDSRKYHNINLQFFRDANLNGILDKEETLLANEIIKLDSYIAKTDEKGKASFKNVPKGSYTLKVNENGGLRIINDPLIVVEKNVNLQVELGKNNKVVGKLIEIKQAYDELQSDVRGVVVYAEDEEGSKTYTAVNQNEEFEFFLKNGTYRIFIENQRFEFLEPSQIIHLKNTDYHEMLIFEFVKKDREIKVKKF